MQPGQVPSLEASQKGTGADGPEVGLADGDAVQAEVQEGLEYHKREASTRFIISAR